MEHRWLYGWAMASVAFGGASLVVPLYVIDLGGGAIALGILFAVSSLVGVPGGLGFGRLADRTGRRRVFVLVAMGLSFATLVVIPVLETVTAVIVGYAVLWLGFSAAVPVLTLLVTAEAPEPEWPANIALLNKMQGVGWTVGLLIGFVLIGILARSVQTVTAQRVFLLVCALATAGGFVHASRTLPPDPDPGTVPSPRRLRRGIARAGSFNVRSSSFPFAPSRIDLGQFRPDRFRKRFTATLATYYLAVLLSFAGFGIFFAILPIYLGDVGYGSSEIFALYFLLNLGAAAFFGRAATLASHHPVTLVQTGGLVIRAAAFLAIAFIGHTLGFGTLAIVLHGLLFVIVGLTWAIVAVTAATLVARLSPPIIRGEALGVYTALVALAGGIGGLLGGWIAELSYPIAFTLSAVLIVLGGATVYVLHRRLHRGATAASPATTAPPSADPP